MMSTFTEDNDKTKHQQTTTPTITPLATSSFSDYTNSLNSKYQEKIRNAAQSSNYKIDLSHKDGMKETITYTRMKLLQWQFDEIEDLRIEAAELSMKSERMIESNKKLREMYRNAAKYLLFNTKTEKPMTDEEYDSCYFQDLRPAIDSAILLSLISDPN
jgi:hypothetical protein